MFLNFSPHMAKKIMKAVKDNKVDEVERLLTRRSASPNECDGDVCY